MTSLKGRKQSPEHVAARVAAIRTGRGFQNAAAVAASAEKRRGKPLSPEHRTKIGKANLGNQYNLGYKATPETRAKLSAAMQGKATAWLKGRKLPEEHRRKLSDYWKANPEKHNHYVDGKGWERQGERVAARSRLEYRLWREAVFTRDNYTCVLCGVAASGHLQADHIKPWALYPELRYEVANGRVLCEWCHYKQPTHGVGSHLSVTFDLADL